MSRTRASAKAAGATSCAICGSHIETTNDKRTQRKKYCSRECLNEHRRRRYALNPKPRKPRPTLSERLWSRVEKLPTGCWEWQGYRLPSGHGQIEGADRRVTTTHRAAWETTFGPIPDGLLVRHKCDNPPCVNPEHLELGTAADNSRDAVERGRNARGFALPQTVLSIADVTAIRSRYRVFTIPGRRGRHSNRNELATEFGVSPGHIKEIVGGRERVNG